MKYRRDNSSSYFGRAFPCIMLGILVITLAPQVHAVKKKKAKQPETKPETPEISIDTSKLVWPNPPDIARIRWLAQSKGERVPTIPAGSHKKRQTWMDRVAGIQHIDEINTPHPHVLVEPYGIAVDSKGNIYVADTYVGAIFVFSPDLDKIDFIHNGNQAHFEQIIGLAIDDDDRLFVSDSHMKCVFVFDAAHHLLKTFGADSLGRPSGIALDMKNRFLYVADVVKNEVAVFDADSFKRLRTVGSPPATPGGEDPGTLARPTNVAVSKDGNVYVADTINNRIQIFDAYGDFIGMFGRAGDGPGYFGRPKGLAVDCDGHIWVVDTTMDRVQVFDREGRLAAYFGIHGTLPGQFVLPTGIAIDKANRVIVTEQFKGRVQFFRYVTDEEAAALKSERDKSVSAVAPAKPATTDAPNNP